MFVVVIMLYIIFRQKKTISMLEIESRKQRNEYNSEIQQVNEELKERKRMLEIESQKQRNEYNNRIQQANEEFEEKEQQFKITEMVLQRDLKKYKELNDKREESLKTIFEGHKKAFPFLASIMADYMTYDIKILSDKLNWGHNQERAKKVASINSIRASAMERIEEAKIATYQLDYLLELYPALEDVLDVEEYSELDYSDHGYLEEVDPVKNYLSKEEWTQLPTDERNQRALDNYIKSHSKSKWQIGRDYELFVGYKYEQKGYSVTYFGETQGLEDLGRDLICRKDGKTQIVQCKYWSKDKQIHEKHIFQLFATTVSYCIDHSIEQNTVAPVFVTNITLSEEAKRVAKQLNVIYIENQMMGDYPRIKCNNGIDEYGLRTKIYHLPMDQQYDKVLLNHDGDMRVFTVQEAVNAGFRRAYKWKA